MTINISIANGRYAPFGASIIMYSLQFDSLGCKISRNIGRHPNDKELSFYLPTPSGVETEIGGDALVVDEDQWQSDRVCDRMSKWGHEIPGAFSTELNLRLAVHGLRSLERQEFLPW